MSLNTDIEYTNVPSVQPPGASLKSTATRVLLGAGNETEQAKVETNIELDVYAHNQTHSTINAIALDSKTRYVAAALYNNSFPYNVEASSTITLIVARPDGIRVQVEGTTYEYSDAYSPAINGTYAELTQAALAIKGSCRAQFKIVNGEQILRTEIFSINNGEALDDSDDWAGDLDGHNLDEMAESIETLETSVGTLQTDVSGVKEDLTHIDNTLTDSPLIDSDGQIEWLTNDGFISTKCNLPKGTYTFLLNIATSPVTNNIRVRLCKSRAFSSNNILASINLTDGVNSAASVTVDEPIQSIFIFAHKTTSLSAGHTITVNTFKMFSGYHYDDTKTFDVASVITSALTAKGKVHLHEGEYLVSGITMPSSSCIEGDGDGTKLYLADSSTGAAITMGDRCTVKDVSVIGASADLTLDGDLTNTRCGIAWNNSSAMFGVITRCRISRFALAGIIAQDTGTPVDHNLAISDCFITNCNVGIYIRKDSEFNKIVNCTIVRNYYGYFNRGGNNDICNCGLDSNTIGIQIDADEGSNGGHGTITGCSINHSGGNSGYGLIINSTGRMLITNCNFYYSKVKLEGTNGNVLNGCGFGVSAWEILTGGNRGCNIFVGCMLKSLEDCPITIGTGATAPKIVGCFTRGGTEVVVN